MSTDTAAPTCSDRCDGGWVQISEASALHLVPEPELPEEDTAEAEAERLRLLALYRAQRAAAVNTWYPCKVCNTRAFFMWANGHWAPDHDRTHCDTCADVRPHFGRRRKSVSPPLATAIDYTAPKEEPF